MVGKPLFDILSKLPSKSLLRFRCVSKLWREYIDDSYFVSVHDKQVTEDPTPIIFYLARNSELAKTLCFHMIESDNITNHVLKAKSNPVFEYNSEDGARQVIWFDVKNEEFGLIKPPKRNNIYPLNGHLVNLDGQVGYFGDATTVWLLNDKKEWMLHCDFKDHEFPDDS
ncbi:F-box domain containing protein, partial [Tanacetum coccineum]